MYSVADLETFVAIVEQGGVTAAADRLDLAPATVSHRLAKLEQHLGTSLFHRDARHFAPSEEGQLFFDRVGDILDQLREAERAIGKGAADIEGTVRVTLPPWILANFVLPALSDFETAHPKLKIDFLATDRFVNLVEEGQELALRVGVMADSGLLARKIADNERILCAAPSYLERFGHPAVAEELPEHRWVCLPWQRQWRLNMSSGRVDTLTGKVQFTVSNSDSLSQSAEAGIGIAIKSRLAVLPALNEGRLVEVLPGVLADAEAPIWIVRASSRVRSRKLDATSEFLATAIRRGLGKAS